MLADSIVRVFPVAQIHVTTLYYTGEVTATCMENPICDLIIGEIKGASLTPKQELDMKPPPTEQQSGDSKQDYSLAAPTSRQSHEAEQQVTHHPPSEPYRQSSPISIGAVETRAQRLRSQKPVKPLLVPEMRTGQADTAPVTRKEQEEDKCIWAFIVHSEGKNKYKVVQDKGLWYRVTPKGNGEERKQLLLPKCKRVKALTLAHESLMAGHLGMKKD